LIMLLDNETAVFIHEIKCEESWVEA
jgi:hypothetical protein